MDGTFQNVVHTADSHARNAKGGAIWNAAAWGCSEFLIQNRKAFEQLNGVGTRLTA